MLSMQRIYPLRAIRTRASALSRSAVLRLNDCCLLLQRQEDYRRMVHIQSKSLSDNAKGVRISALLQKHLGLSRRQSERMILSERITLYGKVVKSPTLEILPSDKNDQIAIKVDGRLVHGAGTTLQLLHEQQQRDAINNTTQLDDQLQVKRDENVSKDSALNPRVWLCNKLKGELITEDDPDGRPSMLQRLIRGGVGETTKKQSIHLPTHLKPVGRLDMMTEGLMIVTNDGQYARSLELPVNQLWRTYRVRVHGRLTLGKLNAMRRGVTVRIDDDINKKEDRSASGKVVKSPATMVKYKGIKVSIERKSVSLSNRRRRGGLGQEYSGGTNTWLQITCTEGKNRMLRRILGSMGLDVTRLIRISYGDYELNTIPPGKAVEVPCKSLEKMKKKGALFASEKEKIVKASSKREKTSSASGDNAIDASPINKVEWINYS